MNHETQNPSNPKNDQIETERDKDQIKPLPVIAVTNVDSKEGEQQEVNNIQ
jgi:hypothetical protein